MYKLFTYNLIALVVTVVILTVAVLFSPKSFEAEKVSAYECGFEPFNDSRGTYNIHFYVIAILFIIFDLEIAYLFPWAKNLHAVGFWGFWSALLFLAILTLGFIYEWKKGALTWSKRKNKWNSLSFLAIMNISPDFQLLDTVFGEFSGNNFITNLDSTGIDIIKYIIPEILLISLLIFVLLDGALRYNKIKDNYKTAFFSLNYLKKGFFAVALIYFVEIFYWYANPFSVKLLNSFIIIDLYSTILKFILLFLGGILFIFFNNWILKTNSFAWEFSLLMGFALFFMVCMLSAFDLISVYIAMEGLALTLYVLAASDFKVKGSLESSVKYFSLGVIASGVIIFAILLIYLLVGSTNFLKIWYYLGELQNYDNEAYFLGYKLFLKNIELLWNIPLIFLIWGFLFKLAAYPNTMWAPEVYEGSAMPVTAFFAIPVKITFLGVFIRLLYFVFAYLENIWVPLISLAAAGSLVVGCFGALSTDKVKKFLAYASINHMGFMLMGLSSASFKGLSNVWTYLIVYLVMNLVIFAVLLNIRDWKRGTSLVFITDFQYLSANNLFVTVITTIVWFSMAGIPPLAGFFSKYYIFLSAVESSSYFLVFLAIITSIVSTFYYLRFIKIIWFTNTVSPNINYSAFSKDKFLFGKASFDAIVIVSTLFLLFFVFVINYVEMFSDTLASSSMLCFNILI